MTGASGCVSPGEALGSDPERACDMIDAEPIGCSPASKQAGEIVERQPVARLEVRWARPRLLTGLASYRALSASRRTPATVLTPVRDKRQGTARVLPQWFWLPWSTSRFTGAEFGIRGFGSTDAATNECVRGRVSPGP
jgi:hypothetical protein